MQIDLSLSNIRDRSSVLKLESRNDSKWHVEVSPPFAGQGRKALLGAIWRISLFNLQIRPQKGTEMLSQAAIY